MTDSELNTPLSELARRLQKDPRFMSYVLSAYQKQEGLDARELAQELSALPAMLMRLALCKRPDSASPQFVDQVREIADYTLTDESQLANVLRQVDGLEKLSRRSTTLTSTEMPSQAENSFSGLLAAARDNDETEEDPVPSADEQTKPEN